jgi:group II intron reverse transcriptase/maturase
LDVEFLRVCYFRLNRNKAVGIDEVSWVEYGLNLQDNLEQLVSRLKARRFRPLPARRVYIPKNERESRPLGISALENKIVEKGIAIILEAIYERDFLNSSYGFRPNRNCHQALKQLNDLVTFRPVNHIVEADIKGFFDNVSQERLMDFLQWRITDRNLLKLIEKFLKAGYIDDGLLIKADTGTAQGSCLSPILANIFLHYVLDLWFERVVKKHMRGFCELIRYADDFVCVVRYSDDAARILRGLEGRFHKFGLTLHPDKTRKFGFGRFEREHALKQGRRANTFDFLGFTHFCDKTRRGKFKVGRKTSRKKFAQKCKAMNDWLKKVRNLVQMKDWWKTLAAKLRGHFQYYGVSENTRGINNFYAVTRKLVYKWVNRRSQKQSMNWEEFNAYLQHYPLPKPRIVHSFYLSAC